jgi:DNA (cytosine-5)-methyltransferase 1
MTARDLVVDLFAGPGGWDEGARQLGLTTVGIEWDTAACETARAAGHERIQADVAECRIQQFAGARGLIASPPCQDFSLAGKGAGLGGDRGQLVWQTLRWADVLRPEWIACEQVPQVLPIWRRIASTFREMGYFATTFVLDAADYGVPQNRERAFLLAHRHRLVAPPQPTHARNGGHSLFGDIQPWVSFGEALGIDAQLRHVRGAGMIQRRGERPDREPDQPAFTVIGKSRSWVLRTGANTMKHSRIGSRAGDGGVVPYERAIDRPAPTVDTKAGHAWKLTAEGECERRLTVAEVAKLQTFPNDYPWQGSRSKVCQQIGNAIPPLLARHVLAAVIGDQSRARTVPHDAPRPHTLRLRRQTGLRVVRCLHELRTTASPMRLRRPTLAWRVAPRRSERRTGADRHPATTPPLQPHTPRDEVLGDGRQDVV